MFGEARLMTVDLHEALNASTLSLPIFRRSVFCFTMGVLKILGWFISLEELTL